MRWFWGLRRGTRQDRFVFWAGGLGLLCTGGAAVIRLVELIAFVGWGAR
jgi:hypothetical protein